MAKPWAQSFYKSKAWRIVRAQALRRDQYTCCRCGAHAEEVHHLIPLNEANINDFNIALALNNLESLCHTCHTKETKGTEDLPQGFCFGDDGQVIKI